MKHFILLSLLLLFSTNKVSCDISKLRYLQSTDTIDSDAGEADTSETTAASNQTEYVPSSSGGLSTGGIV